MEKTRGNYMAGESTKSYHTGTVDITGRGNAYIVIEGMEDDVFVPFNKLNKAFHKDTVEVYIFPRRNGKKLEGEITKVVERYKSSFIGITADNGDTVRILPGNYPESLVISAEVTLEALGGTVTIGQ